MNTTVFMKNNNTKIPKNKCLDSTLELLTEGYLFIPDRIRKYNSKLFQTRLVGKKAICMSGMEAAKIFYNQNLFTRKGAVPGRIQDTLFGRNAIQTMDGAAHIHRKLLFLSIMSQQQVDRLVKITAADWLVSSKKWENRKQVILFDEASLLLFTAACRWAGVPLQKKQIKQKSKDMCAMIDAFGAAGPRHIKGRIARNRLECWARSIIYEVRTGSISVAKDTALYTIAWHKDHRNELLCTDTAAIELINILRPITAIATYITFGALALYKYPECRDRLHKQEDTYRQMFVQEIRRFYPFGPFLGAKVRNPFQWHDHDFKKGDLVFLDIYGTNHDAAVWKEPNLFQPERFRNREENPFDFIPQGGGEHKLGTRCPGEQLTIELLKISMDYLANHMEYQVPLQDFSYSLRRIPTLPKSKFIICNVKNKSK